MNDLSAEDALREVLLSLVSAGALVAVLWFRDLIVHRILWFGRWLYSHATRKRYVLLWIDDDFSHARKLVSRLAAEGADQTTYRALRRPRSVLNYPLRPSTCRAVVLLNTDVTKLADEPRVARRIEEALKEYVECGGGLVGTHDVIYRRVRSEDLQIAFGCRITNFRRAPTVRYAINPKEADHPLREGLPDEFQLEDGELCWGDWAPDVAAIYTASDLDGHPVVAARSYAEGRLVWLNSGDKGDWLCASIAKPDPRFLRLLENAFAWVSTN